MPTTRQWGLAAASLWGVAALASIPFFGVLGLLNIPQWMLNIKEALEFFVWISMGNNPLELLGSIGRTREATEILLGLPAFPAWLATIGAAVSLGRERRWRATAVVSLFVLLIGPLTSGVAAYWAATGDGE